MPPAPDSPSTPQGTVTLGQKLAYGCGDLSSNLVWGLMLSFLTYYYTDIYVIPAAVVAWLLLVPRFFDAFLDPLIGYLVDRTGGRHVIRIMGVLALPFGLCAFFCFLPLPLSPSGKVAWAFGTYFVLGAVYSAINTPYGVLSNMIATTSQERVDLNAFRVGGCQLGQFLIACLLLPSITWFGGGTGLAAQRAGVPYAAAIIGVSAALLWLATARGSRVRRPLPSEHQSLRRMLSVLARNRRFHLACALTFCDFVIFCTEDGLAIHYTRLMLHHPARDASFLLTSMTVMSFLGIALLPPLTKRLGLRGSFLALLVAQLAGLALMFACSGHFWPFLAAFGLHSLAVGPMSPLCYTMLSEAVDEGRARTGVAAAGMAFALNTLVSKLAVAFVGFAIGSFLAWGQYTPAIVAPGATLQFWLQAGFFGMPGAAILASFVLVLASRRDDAPVFMAQVVAAPLHG